MARQRARITGPNRQRVLKLASRVRRPKFRLGELVHNPRDPDRGAGAIDAIYMSLASAINSGVVRSDWYAGLRLRPKTPRTGVWYSVVLGKGAILAGEDDLRRA
jgi:hypothetical protein